MMRVATLLKSEKFSTSRRTRGAAAVGYVNRARSPSVGLISVAAKNGCRAFQGALRWNVEHHRAPIANKRLQGGLCAEIWAGAPKPHGQSAKRTIRVWCVDIHAA
jgi:hypothetical protein